jgi:glycosyltransferase involved in cell wall biosynthesis
MTQSSHSPVQLKALISTIEPIDGGVPSMTKWICKLLEERNILPTLAWYAPWRNYPKLSVPVTQIGRHTAGVLEQRLLNKYPSYGLGAWYPEFEFTHYWPGRRWKQLVDQSQLHIVVSGNTLAATPFVYSGTPFISWIATPWEADRKDRILTFSKRRRMLDSVINKPILLHLEKEILKSPYGTVLALSRYTSKELEKISSQKVQEVMLMPVDTKVFFRDVTRVRRWRVGFSGRYADPRKNIDLLLKAGQIILKKGIQVEIVLVGDKDSKRIEDQLIDYGLNEHVTCYQHMNPQELSALLQTLDLFVIPSHQEGLCISALEAMACGVPIVSTRCGGPEEYVVPFETGTLVDHSPESLAAAIMEIASNRELRTKLSNGCCNWIQENASQESSRQIFSKHLFDLARRNGIEHLLRSK